MVRDLATDSSDERRLFHLNCFFRRKDMERLSVETTSNPTVKATPKPTHGNISCKTCSKNQLFHHGPPRCHGPFRGQFSSSPPLNCLRGKLGLDGYHRLQRTLVGSLIFPSKELQTSWGYKYQYKSLLETLGYQLWQHTTSCTVLHAHSRLFSTSLSWCFVHCLFESSRICLFRISFWSSNLLVSSGYSNSPAK